LTFLHSHTVHHHALIRIMLKYQKIPLSRDFGVAPSTSKHRHHVGMGMDIGGRDIRIAG